jgi:hypothetical protein
MKKAILPLIALSATFLLLSFGDACDKLALFKEGASTTMTTYEKDGKITSTNKTVYTGVTKTGDEVSVTGNSETFDKKGNSSGKNTFTMKCKGGAFYMDMRSMVTAEQQSSFKDAKVKIESTDMEFPSELTVGSTLKDASFSMTTEAPEGGFALPLSISIKVTNRKVEAKETVTTPAGAFECYKLTADVESKFVFKFSGKSVTWYNPEVGTVKSETYNNKGKMQDYSLLTELKK